MANLWLDKKEYPFASHHFEINGHRLHYIDEGKGETILFVHGTPSWSFDYRHLIKDLTPDYRCIAIDHMGFGLSDKPAHYDYSSQSHCQTLEAFVFDKKLDGVTLVVHDFGGPIGLNFAIRHPEKIKRIVVLNSWLWSSKGEPGFERISKVLKSPLLPFLYRYLNFSPQYILPSSFGNRKISRTLLKQYTRPFASPSERNGTLAFARSLLNDQDWFEALWDRRAAISAKPVLFCWGMKDPVIGPNYLKKFESGFACSTTVKLETCGHFPQEEQPESVLEAIIDFLKKPFDT